MSAARAALSRIVSPAANRAFLPDYSDAAFVAMLAGIPADASAASHQEVLRSWKDEEYDRVRQAVVHHFDRRTRPRFFFDPIDAPALASAIDQASNAWQDRLQRWTMAATTEGLEVYGRKAAPLQPGFPWGGHPFAAFDDLVFAARPHRFAFAPTLACATLVGRASVSLFQNVLVDWCKFVTTDRFGLGFVSNLVVAQRFIACSWAYALLGPAGDAPSALHELKWQLLKVMAQDVIYLRPRLGSSYPNNHLLVDRFVAWYIAALFPELGLDRATSAVTEELWLRECETQTYPDGGYFEPSVRYQGLASELLSGYVLLTRRQGRNPPEWADGRLEAMLRFQARLGGPDGQPPELGDGTEDPIFPLAVQSGSSQGLSTLYRLLFAHGESGVAASEPGWEWAFWMLGGRIPVQESGRPPVGFAAFPDTGVFVFSENDERTRLVLRTAPSPERRVMPGHMHSDLMSVYLVESGTPLIVDSGTFSYRFGSRNALPGTAHWRTYFTGASAHNTVLLGGQDPLHPLSGDFRSMTEVPRAAMLSYRASARLAVAAARLDGPRPYAGLVRGVVHVCNEYFLIWSVLPPESSPEEARFLFQLAPGADVEARPAHLEITRGGTSMALVYSSGLEHEAPRRGSLDPISGWVSPRYGEIIAAPQVVLRVTDQERLSAIVLRGSEEPAISSIGCQTLSGGASAIRVEGTGFSDLVVLNLGPAKGQPVLLERISFDGEVLWLREAGDGSLALRALAAREVTLPDHGIALSAAADPEDFDHLKQA